MQIPQGTEASPSDVGDVTLDSDGVPDGLGFSVSPVTVVGVDNHDTDFGFFTPAVAQPGTGTPGYWKNHPDAWPVDSITVGGVSYSKARGDRLAEEGREGQDHDDVQLARPGHAERVDRQQRQLCDKDHRRRRRLDGHCIPHSAATSRHRATRGTYGEPMHKQMDYYNNGLLCAPHRN